MSAWIEHATWLTPIALACVAGALALALAGRALGARRARLLGEATPRDRAGAGRDLSLAIALLAIGVALVGPRIGHITVLPSRGGADVVLLFDLSRSMDAADTAPGRLDRAVVMATALLERLDPGDRVALAGFAARGVLFTPLTPDREAIARMLPRLDTRMVRPGGSDLAGGVREALRTFDSTRDRPRVIALFSDGEVSDPSGAVGAEAASRADVRVVAVGLGSEDGAIVPGRGDALRDDRGHTVTSRRHLGTLERLTAATDGVTFAATRWGEVPLEPLAAAVDRDARRTGGAPAAGPADAKPRRVRVALAWPFALAAFALLLFEAIAATGARIPGAARVGRALARALARRRGLAVTALLACLAATLGADHGHDDGERAVRAVRHGLALAADGDAAAARARFAEAAVLAADPSTIAVAEHNLGVLALDRGELETARDHFLTALAYAPRDYATRFNAEWTLRALAWRAASPPAQTETRAKEERDEAGETSPDEREEIGSEEGAPGESTDTGDGERDDEAPSIARAPADATAHDGRGGGGTPTPSLDPAAQAGWLERVEDDPSRSMRLATRDDERGQRAPRRGMTW